MDLPLSEIITLQKGKQPKNQSAEMRSGFVPNIDIKAFEQGLYEYYTDGKGCVPCEEGDILIVCDGARSGLVGRARKGVVGSTLAKIEAPSCIDKNFLFYFIQWHYKELNTKMKGTGTPHINPVLLGSFVFPVINENEQHRIVTKIDALFSKLDKGVETLHTIRRQLRTYRQAVLKWAFEGKEWEYKPFSVVAPSRLGKMLDKEKNTGTFHKYLRNVNVRWFGFDCSDLLEMKMEENEIEKYQVKKGDLLICEGGEPGRCAIWKSEQTIAFQKALHRVRPKDEIITKFLMYFISFITATGAIKPFFTGTGIKHLTGESLNKIPVPVPSISEQEIIVAAIESRLSVCDKLEQVVDETLAKAAALRQSILKKAFAGQLVPQNPNDEPAKKLLDRIKAAKAAAAPQLAPTRRKKKNGCNKV